MGTMIGPVVGALLVYGTTELLRDVGGYHLIIFALLVIVIARFFRSGLWGLLVLVVDRLTARSKRNQVPDRGTMDNVVS
jgi:branched-chain amino acid transport system permease protein